MSAWQWVLVGVLEVVWAAPILFFTWLACRPMPDFRSMSDEVLDHACREHFGVGMEGL